jgi:hypothetical protein
MNRLQEVNRVAYLAGSPQQIRQRPFLVERPKVIFSKMQSIGLHNLSTQLNRLWEPTYSLQGFGKITLALSSDDSIWTMDAYLTLQKSAETLGSALGIIPFCKPSLEGLHGPPRPAQKP